MRVVAYLRVSTDRQAEEGNGLDIQRDAIRAWAKAAGHRVARYYTDDGVSGSNGLESRVALPEAMAHVRDSDGKIAGLVVYRLDRLARDLIVQETLLAELRRMGAHVFSTSAAEAEFLEDDPDDPARRMIRQVLGAVAEYERAMIALRLRSGRQSKAARGGYAGYGSPPYGWRAEGRELVRVPNEQAALELIREQHAAGASLREIGRALEAAGHRPKRGERWHPQALARIVARLDQEDRRAPLD